MRHLSPRTEKAYVGWIRRFVSFHSNRNPSNMGPPEVRDFVNHLATTLAVSASTQSQALCALLFLYTAVLKQPVERFDELVRAQRPTHIPTVMSHDEVQRLFSHLSRKQRLMAMLTYGSGLRLMECVTLRVKDVDFDRREIRLRAGKGDKDRVVPLAASLLEPLRTHLREVRAQYERDLEIGSGWVEVPNAILHKYPNAAREWPRQWVFPAARTYFYAPTNQTRRHHYHESAIQRAVRQAAKDANITKHVHCHALRHSFATTVPASETAGALAERRGSTGATGVAG